MLHFLLSRYAARALSEFLFAHYRPSITYKKFPERIYMHPELLSLRVLYILAFPIIEHLLLRIILQYWIVDILCFLFILLRLYILIIKILLKQTQHKIH